MITKRIFALMVGIYLVYRVIAEYLIHIYDLIIGPFTINVIFFVATVAFIVGYTAYIQQYTKNMDAVERFLRNNSRGIFKTVQERYNSFLWYYANDDLEKAEEELSRIKSKRHQWIKAVGMATLHISRNNTEEALKEVEKIKNPNANQIKLMHLASIAILKDDWDTYEAIFREIKDERRRYVLQADVAFRKGDLPKASEFGNLAIKHAKGAQKYLMLKDLEKQKNNPNRRTYF